MPTIDIEKTLADSIPINPNNHIITASLVPNPFIVIGICPISVVIGRIAKK